MQLVTGRDFPNEMVQHGVKRSRPIGRLLRFIVGILLLATTLPFLFRASEIFLLLTLVIFLALVGFYSLIHYLIFRFFHGINRWVGAGIANLPVFLVFLLGMSGGTIFGNGEGQLGVLIFIGVSLVLAGIRADYGCEVLSIPGLFLGRNTHLACIVFSPIDWFESKGGS